MAHQFKGKSITQIWEHDISTAGDRVVGLVYNGLTGKIYGCLVGTTHQADAVVVTEYDEAATEGTADYRIWGGTVKGIRFTKAWEISPKVKPNFFKLKGVKSLGDCHKKVTEVIKLPEPLKVLGTQLASLHLANLLGIEYSLNAEATAKVRQIQKALGPVEWKKLCSRINRATDTILGVKYDDETIEPDSNRNDPMAELNALIGMEEVKTRVKEIVTFLERRGKASLPCLHMVFRGNPGTGKTTVARIIGRVFADLGVIDRRGIFIETDRGGLIAQYVGHTALKTEERINEAMGGVLFIDEAYSLGMYNRGNDFGEECIATLVKAMEDHRQDFVCVMAGYPNEMNDMLATNPGLKHRVQFYVDFPDYSADELTEIFMSFCHKGGYAMDEQAEHKISECFALIAKNKGSDFANARLVRKVYERVQMSQALRTAEMEIVAGDIASALGHRDMLHILHGEKSKVVGFSS